MHVTGIVSYICIEHLKITIMNLINKIDKVLNQDTCETDNYTKLVQIRQCLKSNKQLNYRQIKVLKSENLF